MFQQLRGLGRSSMATFYGIASLHEARAYLAIRYWGRGSTSARTVLELEAGSLHEIFGSPDDMKFQSSMSLFSLAAAEPASVFYRVLDRWCGGTLRSVDSKASAGGWSAVCAMTSANLESREDIWPTDPAIVIRQRDEGIELVRLRWGFAPATPKRGRSRPRPPGRARARSTHQPPAKIGNSDVR